MLVHFYNPAGSPSVDRSRRPATTCSPGSAASSTNGPCRWPPGTWCWPTACSASSRAGRCRRAGHRAGALGGWDRRAHRLRRLGFTGPTAAERRPRPGESRPAQVWEESRWHETRNSGSPERPSRRASARYPAGGTSCLRSGCSRRCATSASRPPRSVRSVLQPLAQPHKFDRRLITISQDSRNPACCARRSVGGFERPHQRPIGRRVDRVSLPLELHPLEPAGRLVHLEKRGHRHVA